MSHKIEQEIEDLASKLEKAASAGEGVRGGQIVGHTPSGQPIYESNLNAQKQWREQHKKPAKNPLRMKKNEDKEEKVKKSEGELEMEAKDLLKGIMDKIKQLGPDGLKKASESLTEEQKALLEKILSKAVSMDREAVKKPKNIKDLDSHEVPKQEGGMDEEDEKLVKPEAAGHRNQGDNSPEGIEGQVIKSDKPKVQGAQKEFGGKDASKEYVEKAKESEKEDEVEIPKKKFKEEHKKLVQVLESPSREDDKKEAKEQKKEMKQELGKKDSKMKKSEQFEDIIKSDENLSKLCKKAMGRKMEKKAWLDKCGSMGWDVKKCESMWDREEKASAKMKKSVVWNDLNSDLLGSTAKRGRNYRVGELNDAIEKQESAKKETLSKGGYLNEFTHEIFSKSENKKVSVNDLIEQKLDRDFCDVEQAAHNLNYIKNPSHQGAKLTKSFEEDEIIKALGIDLKKAEEILGKK